jgi:hypothetical protein
MFDVKSETRRQDKGMTWGSRHIVRVVLAFVGAVLCSPVTAKGQAELDPGPIPPRFNQSVYEQTVFVRPAAFGGFGAFSMGGFATHPDLNSAIQVFLVGPPSWMSFSSVSGNPATFKIESNGLPMPTFGTRSYSIGAETPAAPSFGSSAVVRLTFLVPEPAGALLVCFIGMVVLFVRFR